MERTAPSRRETLEEIRIRKGLPLCLVLSSGDVFLSPAGTEVKPEASFRPDGGEVQRTFALLTDCSSYAMEVELATGYVTLPGGHRVGLVGRMAAFSSEKHVLREVYGFNIRIARHVKGVSEKVLPLILTEGPEKKPRSTLIVSPPRAGKTTMLRDLSRVLSEGRSEMKLHPCHVGVVDERSEIAACYDGVPQHDLGPRVDVLDRCPKAMGMMMVIRSMSPDVVVTDEIGGDGDARACAEACAAGVAILASAHARDIEDLARRPYSSWLVDKGYFEVFVVLSRRNGPGTVEYVGPRTEGDERGG
ncbi:MAG TPA: stage III sporulation protein AA [Firmicutes bacterium]|nr:stage III sporulation protein AA [Candidatus Fermentithermobacillaceae bacterium]